MKLTKALPSVTLESVTEQLQLRSLPGKSSVNGLEGRPHHAEPTLGRSSGVSSLPPNPPAKLPSCNSAGVESAQCSLSPGLQHPLQPQAHLFCRRSSSLANYLRSEGSKAVHHFSGPLLSQSSLYSEYLSSLLFCHS